ncbi:hypothetical protein Cassandra_0347 [Pseudomonas phage Cassandra]|nr:hypothetical protein Cassandra_0347 [Pseudomonas phage Cassandra]WPK40574.1 hypothetical protein Paride_0344 [Pseudomonas phage Paride]
MIYLSIWTFVSIIVSIYHNILTIKMHKQVLLYKDYTFYKERLDFVCNSYIFFNVIFFIFIACVTK